jgi:hypothetical protein
MKRVWFVTAVLAVPVVVGGIAVVYDHTRASVRIRAGVDGASADEDRATLVAATDSAAHTGREPAAPGPARTGELEVHVVAESGEPLEGADVLVERGAELLRAGRTDVEGIVRLLQFSGACSVRVEQDSQEIARQELAHGRGRVEIVVSAGASLEATALVGGRPRGGIRFELVNGLERDGFVEATLEAVGMRHPSSPREEETDSDGVVRFPYLRSEWSGALRLSDSDYYRFADGSETLPLERPTKGLVLELEDVSREPTISGRVVFGGQPVPHVCWRAVLRCRQGSWAPANECDAEGRFFIHAPDEQMELAQLEFLAPGVGRRRLELHGNTSLGDLGDIELEPVRTVHLIVQTVSGEPIAGARAVLPDDMDLAREDPLILGLLAELGQSREEPHRRIPLFLASAPTDADGRTELPCVAPGFQEIRVGARGYATTNATIPASGEELHTVVLERGSAVDVTVRDSEGAVPPGLRVVITAPETPFTWKERFYPSGEELALGARALLDPTYSLPFAVDCPLETSGDLRFDSLRPGTSFDLWIVDACGKELAESSGLVLEPGEWRSLAFEVTQKPRQLVVHVHDAFGNPIPNVRLAVSRQDEGRAEEWIWGTSLVSDRAGMVRAPSLYADELTLSLRARGFEPRWIQHVPLPTDGATVDVRLAHDWWPW